MSKNINYLIIICSDWQKNRRGRIYDYLPYRQDGGGKRIIHEAKEIDN